MTETPEVQAALDDLRRELGTDRVALGELVILGARAKLDAIRAEKDDSDQRLSELVEMIRTKTIDTGDVELAEEAKRSWVKP